jgi:hypothetical protein
MTNGRGMPSPLLHWQYAEEDGGRERAESEGFKLIQLSCLALNLSQYQLAQRLHVLPSNSYRWGRGTLISPRHAVRIALRAYPKTPAAR